MATEPQLRTGDEIAGYTLESLIGRGGMGEVFRAVDGHLARAVALKVLAPGLVHDEASRDRILRESQLAASIDHPNVIPVYAAGEADGHVYIAMRLVEGSDLRSVLRRDGRLEPARAIALVAQVASALDAAHARGLVHRDVKPSNVLIDSQQEREHCYLADFGITTTAERPAARGRLAAAARHARLRRARTGARRPRRRAGRRVFARLPRSSSASPVRCRSCATPTSPSCSRTSRSRRPSRASGSPSCRPRSTP